MMQLCAPAAEQNSPVREPERFSAHCIAIGLRILPPRQESIVKASPQDATPASSCPLVAASRSAINYPLSSTHDRGRHLPLIALMQDQVAQLLQMEFPPPA